MYFVFFCNLNRKEITKQAVMGRFFNQRPHALARPSGQSRHTVLAQHARHAHSAWSPRSYHVRWRARRRRTEGWDAVGCRREHEWEPRSAPDMIKGAGSHPRNGASVERWEWDCAVAFRRRWASTVAINDPGMVLRHNEKEGKVTGWLIGGEPRGGWRSPRGRDGDNARPKSGRGRWTPALGIDKMTSPWWEEGSGFFGAMGFARKERVTRTCSVPI
jgi:hypothetical protein